MENAGVARIEIVPDTSRFEERLRAELAIVLDRVAADVRRLPFGTRIEDGGLMGTIVRCSVCGGSGQLHDPDEEPEPDTPIKVEPVWQVGDPCNACGSTNTVFDPALGGVCKKCGATDADE